MVTKGKTLIKYSHMSGRRKGHSRKKEHTLRAEPVKDSLYLSSNPFYDHSTFLMHLCRTRCHYYMGIRSILHFFTVKNKKCINMNMSSMNKINSMDIIYINSFIHIFQLFSVRFNSLVVQLFLKYKYLKHLPIYKEVIKHMHNNYTVIISNFVLNCFRRSISSHCVHPV